MFICCNMHANQSFTREKSLQFRRKSLNERLTNGSESLLFYSSITNSLGVHLDAGCIDRSHRIGRTSPKSAGNRNPRLAIVKFTSYEPRRAIFTSKRKLKGTHIVITENLTRRRVNLVRKARDSPNVEASWTSDGRIVCLLTNGRKVTVTNECHLQGLNV